MIMLDTTVAPYDDVHVRRAIAYALDRVALTKSVLQGHARPAVMLPTPDQWAGLDTSEVKALYSQSTPMRSISTGR